MEESYSENKSLEQLAIAGQQKVDASVQAAHEILASLNEVLSNPDLWVVPPPSSASEPATQQQEAGWAAVDDARLRYRQSTSALRNIIDAIFSNSQIENEDDDCLMKEKRDPEELDKLEKQVADLRQEVHQKNNILKQLISQTRELIIDISMWQSPNTYLFNDKQNIM